MTTGLVYSGYNVVPRGVYAGLHLCKRMWWGGTPSKRTVIGKHALHLCNLEAHTGGACVCLCGSTVLHIIPLRRVHRGRLNHDEP